jgi:hypothetical protein
LEPLATIRSSSLIAVALSRLNLVVGHGIGGLGRCRRNRRDGDQTGEIPAED